MDASLCDEYNYSPRSKDVVAFQCRNPIHRAHYELFTRALDAPNVDKPGGAIVLVHPTVGPTQSDDIPGTVRFETYEVLRKEVNNPRIRWVSAAPYGCWNMTRGTGLSAVLDAHGWTTRSTATHDLAQELWFLFLVRTMALCYLCRLHAFHHRP